LKYNLAELIHKINNEPDALDYAIKLDDELREYLDKYKYTMCEDEKGRIEEILGINEV
jgi:hypothetical protein